MLESTITTRADSKGARQISKAALCIISEHVDDTGLLYDFDLVITEACANVVIHAYKNSSPGNIELHLCINEFESVLITVNDWGEGFGFDPEKLRLPPEQSESGRGLVIMATLMDYIHVEKKDGKNSIILRKDIGKELWKT